MKYDTTMLIELNLKFHITCQNESITTIHYPYFIYNWNHIESFAKYILLLQSMTFTMVITLSIILIYYFAPFLVSSFALVFAL